MSRALRIQMFSKQISRNSGWWLIYVPKLGSLSLSTVYSRDLYFASFQATLWERRIHLQTISILFEQFLAVLLGLI